MAARGSKKSSRGAVLADSMGRRRAHTRRIGPVFHTPRYCLYNRGQSSDSFTCLIFRAMDVRHRFCSSHLVVFLVVVYQCRPSVLVISRTALLGGDGIFEDRRLAASK